MITKNFKTWLNATLSRVSYSSTETVTLPQPIKTVTGESLSSIYYSAPSTTGGGLPYFLLLTDTNKATDLSGQVKNSIQLFVGTNDTPATKDDYTLDVITTLSSAQITSLVRSINGDNQAITISRTFTNTSDESITIKEVGLVKSVSTSSSASVNLLFAREVLPTPLVVPSGANFTVSMVVKV